MADAQRQFGSMPFIRAELAAQRQQIKEHYALTEEQLDAFFSEEEPESVAELEDAADDLEFELDDAKEMLQFARQTYEEGHCQIDLAKDDVATARAAFRAARSQVRAAREEWIRSLGDFPEQFIIDQSMPF